MLRAVPVDIVMRPDRLLQLIADNHPWALGCGATGEHHNSGTSVGERRLQEV